MLAPRSGGLYVDATVGGGGHAAAILAASAPQGRLIGLDWDDDALVAARARLAEFGARVELVHSNFADLEQTVMALGVTTVDGVLFDLGVSSHQLREASRGFSWQQAGPLDMRMCRKLGVTARDILRTASLEELAEIFRRYGEEPRARAVARAIVAARERGEPLETTTDLARLCGPRRGRIHPATRVFQALRIAVNRELENLRQGLAGAWRVLRPGGRLVVIAFHSLEDRIVKQFTRSLTDRGEARVLTRKPRTASPIEIQANPRARSAKLRAAEKL